MHISPRPTKPSIPRWYIISWSWNRVQATANISPTALHALEGRNRRNALWYSWVNALRGKGWSELLERKWPATETLHRSTPSLEPLSYNMEVLRERRIAIRWSRKMPGYPLTAMIFSDSFLLTYVQEQCNEIGERNKTQKWQISPKPYSNPEKQEVVKNHTLDAVIS